jgi:CRISPR-associated protein Cas2
MLTWVIYDISDDRLRSYTANICKRYGLYRVQKSCFLGEIDKNQRDSMTLEFKEYVLDDDSIYVFVTCDSCAESLNLLGEGFDMELVRDQIGVMFL